MKTFHGIIGTISFMAGTYTLSIGMIADDLIINSFGIASILISFYAIGVFLFSGIRK